VAASNIRRGATVLTKEELEYQIGTVRKFIEKQRAAQDRMRTQNSGVRSSSISADLAAFDVAVQNAEDRIKALKFYFSNSIIEYLEVNKAIKNSLYVYSSIRTLNEIDMMPDDELLKYYGIGKNSVKQIRTAADKLRKETFGEN
jgi:hypothetical protein